MDFQFEKNQSSNQLRISSFWLSLQHSRGFGLSKSKENRQTSNSGSFHFAGSRNYSKEDHVSNRGHGFHGVPLEQSLEKFLSNISVDKGPSGLVDGSSELAEGFESAFEGSQYVDVHRCIKEGLGAHLNNCTISGVWQQLEKDLHINI